MWMNMNEWIYMLEHDKVVVADWVGIGRVGVGWG